MITKVNGDINDWILNLMKKGLSVKEIKNLSAFELMEYGIYEKLENIYEDEEVKIFMLTAVGIESLTKTCVFWRKPSDMYTLFEYDKTTKKYHWWGHLFSNGTYMFSRVIEREVREKNKRKGRMELQRIIHPKAKEYIETNYEEFGEEKYILKSENNL